MTTELALGLALLALLAWACFAYQPSARARFHALIGKSSSRAQFIEKYEFPELLRRKLCDRHPGLTSPQVDLVFAGLRQYFLACLMARSRDTGAVLGMPSRVVDEAWHEFILMTRDYTLFCQQGFGEYLHHAPGERMTGPMNNALANTLHQVRGAASPAGWAMLGGVPLLFALDKNLAIADGYIYDQESVSELEKSMREQESGYYAGGWGGRWDGGHGAGNNARDAAHRAGSGAAGGGACGSCGS